MSSTFEISIIDDDLEDVFLIKRAFRKINPEVSVNYLGDGYKFLKGVTNGEIILDGKQHQIILLDINMPEVSGFNVLEALNKSALTDSSKIIMLSTSESDYDKQKALSLGATRFLSKPSQFEALLELADAIITDSI